MSKGGKGERGIRKNKGTVDTTHLAKLAVKYQLSALSICNLLGKRKSEPTPIGVRFGFFCCKAHIGNSWEKAKAVLQGSFLKKVFGPSTTLRAVRWGGRSNASVRPVRVFENGSAHADEISAALLQKSLSLGESGNPSCQKNRDVNRLLHWNRQILEIPRFPMTRAEKTIHAAGEMEQIHAALLYQPTGPKENLSLPLPLCIAVFCTIYFLKKS